MHTKLQQKQRHTPQQAQMPSRTQPKANEDLSLAEGPW